MENIPLFQASGLSDEESKSQFVVRKKEFELVMSDIRTDDMAGSIQHYIFVGQRGSGKSTLLRRIQAEINTDEELKSHLVAVNLSEEQAGIYRLHDLWFKVNEALSMKGFEVKNIDWQRYGTDYTTYARDLYTAMQDALNQKGKKLVLLLDNIDRILGHVKTGDNHLLRELLINFKDIRIIGGSTKLSEHYWKYDQPFYQFFRIIRLESLTQQELQELLMSWAEAYEEPQIKNFIERNVGKLNAVRILSDGMPRTMLHLLRLLVIKPEEHGYEYLRKIMDNATAIYQERLATLSDLQQKVLLELSFYWDATDVNHLSQSARLDGKTLSSILNKLVKLKIVDKRKGKGKNYYYLLHERFFNLWLIMTQGGPKQKSELKAMTVFLEILYSEDELKKYTDRLMNDLSTGCLTADKAIIQAKGLIHSRYITLQQRDDLIEHIKKIADNNSKYIELMPSKSGEIYKKVSNAIEKGQFDEALLHLGEMEQDDSEKDFALGYIFEQKNDVDKAEEYYLKSYQADKDPSCAYFLARCYEKKGKDTEAERFYLVAIEGGFDLALESIGIFYGTKGKLDKAEKYLVLAHEKGSKDALLRLVAFCFDTNQNKKQALKFLKQYEEIGEYALNEHLITKLLYVWLGYPEVLDDAIKLVSKAIDENNMQSLEFFITGVLIHQQKYSVWQWFHDEYSGEKLKEFVKPLYFVTARLINNVETKEILLTQPPELSEPIEKIYKGIRSEQKRYYGE